MLASNTSLKELDLSGYGPNNSASSDAEFAKAFAVGLSANGALTSLNMSCNKMASEEVGRALGDAIASNSTLTELDISNSCDTAGWAAGHGSNSGPGFAKGITDGLRANGALTSLNMSNNNIGALVPVEGWKSRDNDGRAPWIGPDGQEQNHLPKEPAGAIALADAIKTNGALTSLNISGNRINRIGVDGQAIVSACASKGVALRMD
jgi:Leucine-rich repeat (LRR) protein